MTFIAVFGTTISLCLFVRQAAGEVEETRLAEDEVPLKKASWQAKDQLTRIRIDTMVGMAMSALIAFCIILTAAYMLHTYGITQIETCVQVAEVLKLVTGHSVQMLLAVGVTDTGPLAAPVLASSAIYAATEAFKQHSNLETKVYHTPRFYLFLTLVMVVAMVMVLLLIEPLKLLYWAAVFNDTATISVMVMLRLMSRRKMVMGPPCSSRPLHGTVWMATLCMCASTLLFFMLAVRGA